MAKLITLSDLILFLSLLREEIPAEISRETIIRKLGYEPLSEYTETDPTIPDYVRSISELNITNWNNKADKTTATIYADGLLSKEDKEKIDGMEPISNSFIESAFSSIDGDLITIQAEFGSIETSTINNMFKED